MNGKFIHIMTVLLALGLWPFGSAFAGDTGSEPEAGAPAAEGSEAALPRAPLRLNTVDFEDTSAGAGKLTLAGVALPGGGCRWIRERRAYWPWSSSSS